MKTYKRRKLHGLESRTPQFEQLNPAARSLSSLLVKNHGDKLYLCGPLELMTREWMREPLESGWRFGHEFAFKHRTAVYEWGYKKGPQKTVHVKLASHRESWFPGCENAKTGWDAWRALESEWKSTGLPLLSSPAATGKALLWETLPCDREGNAIEFPALSDDLAKLIRANSPQHRIENFPYEPLYRKKDGDVWVRVKNPDLIQYDGRWMYASLCGLDRFPIGIPRRAEGFTPYAPGIYNVTIQVPKDWNHVGLLPCLCDGAWKYPRDPGRIFQSWVFEPELTLALKHGWEIFDFYDGYTFEKGRPLAGWSVKLIEMRKNLQDDEKMENETGAFPNAHRFRFAAATVRQVLNHTIGAIHRNDYEREEFISDDNFRKWRREHPDLAESETRTPERIEGGYLVPCFVPDTSPLSIFMPHWSATIYSLARARVAEWALRCDPATLVKIHGDAIYSTCEQPELDKLDDGKTLGKPRRK